MVYYHVIYYISSLSLSPAIYALLFSFTSLVRSCNLFNTSFPMPLTVTHHLCFISTFHLLFCITAYSHPTNSTFFPIAASHSPQCTACQLDLITRPPALTSCFRLFKSPLYLINCVISYFYSSLQHNPRQRPFQR